MASKDDGKGCCGTETVIGNIACETERVMGKVAEAEGGSNTDGSGAEGDGQI